MGQLGSMDMTIKVSGFAVALVLGALATAACQQESAPVTQPASDGIEVTDARMVLNAVSGNPAAIYFTLVNNTERAITLRGASVANAESAMLHSYQEWDGQMVMGEMGPLAVEPGASTTFEPGAQHVMVMGVSPQLQAGGTTEVTLNLLGGGKHSFPVSILPAGSIDEKAPPLPARAAAPAQTAN